MDTPKHSGRRLTLASMSVPVFLFPRKTKKTDFLPERGVLPISQQGIEYLVISAMDHIVRDPSAFTTLKILVLQYLQGQRKITLHLKGQQP